MTATFAQTLETKMNTIEGIALRSATLNDARTIERHRRSMFCDMGYHDEAALEAMMEKFLLSMNIPSTMRYWRPV